MCRIKKNVFLFIIALPSSKEKLHTFLLKQKGMNASSLELCITRYMAALSISDSETIM